MWDRDRQDQQHECAGQTVAQGGGYELLTPERKLTCWWICRSQWSLGGCRKQLWRGPRHTMVRRMHGWGSTLCWGKEAVIRPRMWHLSAGLTASIDGGAKLKVWWPAESNLTMRNTQRPFSSTGWFTNGLWLACLIRPWSRGLLSEHEQ